VLEVAQGKEAIARAIVDLLSGLPEKTGRRG
jgi:hypothetical protein